VDVVGHNHGYIERYLDFVIVQTTIQHNVAGLLGEHPAFACAERNEVGLIVALEMGKLAPVEGLSRSHNIGVEVPINFVGTAALGCPPGRSPGRRIVVFHSWIMRNGE
jgi:hypothetical protein